MVLITYHFQHHQYPTSQGFHYSIEESAVDWIKSVQEFKDGRYILINVLEITPEQAVELEDIDGM